MVDEAPSSDLTGWQKGPFTGAGYTYDCYEKGAGPGVVLIPEIPGITPNVLGLADHLVDEGFTVVIPSPFGTPGKPESMGYALGVFARLCVSREFRGFAVDAKRPITAYLRAVAADLAVERTRTDGLCVLGLRFSQDRAVPPERFAGLRAQLGDAFEVIELDSGPGNAGGFTKGAHSVLTGEVRETPGHPALAARTRTVEFLREHLTPAS